MIQNKCKSSGYTYGYEEYNVVKKLEAERVKLARIELWAQAGGWREGGSDSLFKILSENE